MFYTLDNKDRNKHKIRLGRHPTVMKGQEGALELIQLLARDKYNCHDVMSELRETERVRFVLRLVHKKCQYYPTVGILSLCSPSKYSDFKIT